jgi:DNA-binding NarL/FixJ family response regulator
MTPRRNKRTALLVDRHPLWLDAAEQLVLQSGLSVVAKSTSALAALKLLDRLRPDVLITDIEMEDGELDGLRLLRCARARLPELRVAVLSGQQDAHQVDAALSAGAHAYITKTATPQEIRAAISHTAGPVADSALFQPLAVITATRRASAVSALRGREQQIAELIADGKTAADVARILWMTEDAVASHLQDIRDTLHSAGAPSRASVRDGWAGNPALQRAM